LIVRVSLTVCNSWDLHWHIQKKEGLVDFVRSDARKKYEPSKHYARKSDFCALVEATLMYIRKLGMFLMKITQNHTKKKKTLNQCG